MTQPFIDFGDLIIPVNHIGFIERDTIQMPVQESSQADLQQETETKYVIILYFTKEVNCREEYKSGFLIGKFNSKKERDQEFQEIADTL